MQKPFFLTIKISFVETLESWIAGLGIGLLVLGAAGCVWYFRQTKDLFYPGIVVDTVDIGGLTPAEAQAKIAAQTSQTIDTISLAVDDIQLSSSSAELALSRNYQEVLNQAFQVGRTGFPLSRLATIATLQFSPQSFSTTTTIPNATLLAFLAEFNQKIAIQGETPKATLLYSNSPGTLTISAGSFGRELDATRTAERIHDAVRSASSPSLLLPAVVASTSGQLNEEQLAQARERALLFMGKSVTFSVDTLTLSLSDKELISMLRFLPDQPDAVEEIVTTWQAKTDRPPQEPVFEYNADTLEVSSFVPPKNGLALDVQKTAADLRSALQTIELQNPTTQELPENELTNEFAFDLAVTQTQPKKSLASTNNLGITELIGFGDSEYDNSIPSRIHNVAITAEKVTNHIIKPGEEFSFNKTLGEISSRTGYKPAYVIMAGRTVLGDGGGVCQVSTTLFRSVLDAGLKVSRRLQHSYRVSYYELNSKPGVDATVYSGEVDFRFINDTDHHILISSQADSEELYMTVELYGTSDGRQTEIVDHEIWDYRPALPPVYIPDSSLPTGAVRQVDWAVSGVKAKFTNVIKDKDGAVIREDEYYSNYVPWSAKYLRGV